jgi:actin-like protein 6A
VTRSYADFARLEVAEDFKHHICCVNREFGPAVDAATGDADRDTAPTATDNEDGTELEPLSDPSVPPITYELPDGTQISIGPERYRPAELLFRTLPHARTIKEDRPFLAYIRERERGASSSKGLSGLVADAIRRCEGAQHREMFAGVVITGGSSIIPGLSDRLQSELYFYHSRSRVHAAANPMERKYMAWTGGSILATFSEFQQNWFSRAEYLESGATLVQKRCP